MNESNKGLPPDTVEPTPVPAPATTAGAILRAARQAQGLHLVALATLLKVSPRKLEALENDRYDELQLVSFVRALAQAACRVLKIDPAPVLALLPRTAQDSLEKVSGGLNAPFRERGMKREPAEALLASRGFMGVVLVLIVAAIALWWLPRDLMTRLGMTGGASSNASAPVAAVVSEAASQLPALATSTPLPLPEVSRGLTQSVAQPVAVPLPLLTASSAAGDLPLQLRTREASWIEVTDAKGQVLLARIVAPGEVLALGGQFPVRVKIGNARATELSLRGQPVDLASVTQGNLARIELN